MERKLASVRTVVDIQPIKGADLIDLAYIDGWQCVVKKGEFKIGELGVFFEIDSFLPASDPRFEGFKERFIEWNGKTGMRVRSMKLRKELSQGVLLPMSSFPEASGALPDDDLTELLKIEKWESKEDAEAAGEKPPKVGTGTTKREFPSFLVKTDETRVQNISGMLPRSAEEEFEVSLKLDGSSLTAYVVAPRSPHFKTALAYKMKNKGFFAKIAHWFKLKTGQYKLPVVAVCSRNMQLKDYDGSAFWNIVQELSIDKILQGEGLLGNSVAVQGELISPNIQKNHEQVSKPEFYCFNVFDIDKQDYMLPQDRQVFLKRTGVPAVSDLGFLKLKDVPGVEEKGYVQAILDFAEGPSMNPGVKREGLVFKSLTRDFSFKAVSNSYLLAKG